MISTAHTDTFLRKTVLYPKAPWYFALAMLVTGVGFSFTYFPHLDQANLFHHLHSATAVLWMTLLIVQPILYQRGKFRLHRRLGWLGALVLAPMLVLGGVKMLHQMVQVQTVKLPPEAYLLAYYDGMLLLMFVGFLGLSLQHRKELALHARYIVCTVLVILPPAVFRFLFGLIPGFRSFDRSFHGSIAAIELVLLLLLMDDRRYGPVRRPYLLALGLLLFQTATMSFSADWLWWRTAVDAFANWL